MHTDTYWAMEAPLATAAAAAASVAAMVIISTTAVTIDFHFMLVTVLRIIEHLYPISEDLSLDEAASPEMKDGPRNGNKNSH